MQRVLTLILVLLLAGCDGFGGMTDAEYVARAQDYLDRGELDAASIELKNALSENPQNPQARWLLGKLYVDSGNYPGAEKELSRAKELGVSSESVLPLLGQTYLRLGKYEQVIALLDRSGSLSEKARASLLTSAGLAHLRQGRKDEATETIGEALSLDAGSAYPLYGQIMLSIDSGDLDRARNQLDRLLKRHARYAPGWSLLGDMEQRNNRLEEAEEAYGKAISLRYDNGSDKLKRVFVRIRLKRYDQARKDLDELKAKSPRHPGVQYAQGLLHFIDKDLPKAQESFETALQSNADFAPALFYLGTTQYLQGNMEQAVEYLNRFMAENPDNRIARILVATIRLKQNDYESVENLLQPLIGPESEDVFLLNLMATALLKDGKTQQGIRLLERIVELEPESTPEAALAKAKLGIGYLAGGDQNAAAKMLESAIEIDPNLQQVDSVLVLNYLRQGQADKAVQVASRFVARQPDSPVAHTLLGMAYLAQNRESEAEASFLRATEVAPGDPAASMNLAALAMKRSEPERAREIYDRIFEVHPDDLGALIGLAALQAGQGDLQGAKERLEQAIAAHPDALQPRILLAQIHLRERDAAAALRTLGDFQARQSDTPGVMAVVGEAYLFQNRFREAVRILQQLVTMRPESAQARFLLAKAYAGTGDRMRMEEQLSRALELDPAYYAARMVRANIRLIQGDIDGAARDIGKLKEQYADDAGVMGLEAVLLAKQGDAKGSRGRLEQRFTASPSTGTLLDLVRMEWTLGERKQAIERLTGWLERHPDDTKARMMLADAYLQQGETKAPLEQYLRVLDQSENNVIALLNAALLLREKDPERALSYAEKALSLTPESAAAMDTLAAVLLRAGSIDRARELNAKTLEKAPGSPAYRFRKAQILEASGDREAATRLLATLLSEKAGFRERDQAQALYERLTAQ